MILLDTVLDKVITSDLFRSSLIEIAPKILPIILTIVSLLICKSGIGFCYHMLRNSWQIV